MPVMKILTDTYRADHPATQFRLIMPPMGSGGSLRALSAGVLDLALTSRPLKEKERARGLVPKAFARTPFGFAVHADRPERGFSLAEFAAFYAGAGTTWSDGGPIRMVLRPRGDSDTSKLKSMSPAMAAAVETALARPGMAVAVTDYDSAAMLEKVAGTLGSNTLALIRSENRPLRLLTVDGKRPDLPSLASGAYPFSKTLSFVTVGQPAPEVQGFMDFVVSGAGRSLLERAGCIPASP